MSLKATKPVSVFLSVFCAVHYGHLLRCVILCLYVFCLLVGLVRLSVGLPVQVIERLMIEMTCNVLLGTHSLTLTVRGSAVDEIHNSSLFVFSY